MKLPRSEVAREGEQFQHRADLFSSILAFAMPMSEKALIARIRRKAVPGRSIVTGIGDDSAVLKIPKGHQALVTTDFSLEGVHFWREWHPPESVGHRCLSRGLSDIAAGRSDLCDRPTGGFCGHSEAFIGGEKPHSA